MYIVPYIDGEEEECSLPWARLVSFYAPRNRQLVALLAQYPSFRLSGTSTDEQRGEDGMKW